MQDIMRKVNDTLEQYREQLAEYGIKIVASKHYFEESVGERMGTSGSNAIFNEIDRAIDRKEEKKNGYNHVRNRYHCIVLAVSPVEKEIVRREYCKEYAFVLKKVERAHIGLPPKKTEYAEQKIISKVERRIAKILAKAKKAEIINVCKDTLFDALRYTAPQYGYKRRILNKDRADWELIFLISFGVPVFIVVFALYFIGKLN